MTETDIGALSVAALDAIKPRWRYLPKEAKARLLLDVSEALAAVCEPEPACEPEPVEVDEADEV